MGSQMRNTNNKYGKLDTAILKSLDPNINHAASYGSTTSIVKEGISLSSLSLTEDIDDNRSNHKSVLLLDDCENLRFNSEQSFMKTLSIKTNDKVKVVSIFGNTGEGKSYTLNKVFFDEDEVFKTSSSQMSCTLGVWAMYNPKLRVICLDTEGLLGISKKEQQRTRLLLKVLAVSDIIIYRTRAERLHRDMYSFLGAASQAYKDHFSIALKKALSKIDGENVTTGIGPGVIIFHETRDTDTLHHNPSVTQSAEEILQSTFTELNLSYDAFSFIKYIGVKSDNKPTSFEELKAVIFEKLECTQVRSRRDAKYVYLTLKCLNDKFQNIISNETPQLYQEKFFTCPEKCLSCKSSCSLSNGHKDDGEPHRSDKDCILQHQYQNYVYICKICYKNGHKVIVTPNYQTSSDSSWTSYFNYVWTGYVIECPTCGEIYRSRKHWYGNQNPEDCAVRIDVIHIWPGEPSLFGSQNSAQKVIDTMTMLSEGISHVGAPPIKIVGEWAADLVAPRYWKNNDQIKECAICRQPFSSMENKHHCRACGDGVCDRCSSKRQPVPSKGFYGPERVCDYCYKDEPPSFSNAVDGVDNRARQIGETLVNSISAVKQVVYDIPREIIKEKAQPTYWTPNSECVRCHVCNEQFGPLRSVHHCRDCGKGVCDDCSKARKPVPLRGWDKPSRVCDKCR